MTVPEDLSPAAADFLEQGVALRLEGRLAEALRTFDQAARLQPGAAEIWFERGVVFDLGGSLDSAWASYAESIRLGGGVPPLAGFASVAVRKGDYPRAQQAAEQVQQLAPWEEVSTMVLARCDLERRDFAAVENRLRQFLGRDDLSDHNRMIATGLLGDALDKLDRPTEAFAEYTRSKALFAQIHAAAFATPPVTEFFSRLGKAFDQVTADRWTGEPEQVNGAAENHVFLIGHPRSGTTLVENILASAPGVAALEERQTLRDADAEFFLDADNLPRLAAFDSAGLGTFREAYWRRVRLAGITSDPQSFVDMDPMKGTRLPMITKLFPAAKIVIMRRDPRDVVLSCFRTSFAPTASSRMFTTLEGAAQHYDALMRLQQHFLGALPLTPFELHYEQLVGDFDAVTQALCAFVGIPWSEDLRRFDKTAERRGVTTASQMQVRRGLYDGRAQWRRYEAELAPVLPILQPWIDEFGYAGTP